MRTALAILAVIAATPAYAVYGDDRTVLPEGLTRPAHWPAATPGKQPDNAAWWQL